MAMLTRGTQLYFIDKTGSSPIVEVVQCAISIDGLSGAREQIDITCLEDIARAFAPGLVTPGTMTVTIQFDSTNNSHIKLHELYREGTKFDVAIGFGDGTDAPTLSTGNDFDIPTTRTFIIAEETYISDFPFSFELNAVVTTAIGFQLSGFPALFPKV